MINQALDEILNMEVLSNSLGRIRRSDVHLWSINRVACCRYNIDSGYFLSEDDQKRANKFRFVRDRDLFVTGRYFTRMLLAHYTGSTPDKVNIVLDTTGKPITDGRLNFNLSHSRDQLLLGFSNSDIGVDIEMKNYSTDIERLGRSHFSEIEFQTMMNTGTDTRRDKFFEIWTKKEAIIKGVGKGLGISLQDFTVPCCNEKTKWGLRSGPSYGDWYVRELEVKSGYKAAYSTRNTTTNHRHFCLNN